ncbi:class I SAM-dependent methyltransferase [Taibaiella chishuiensis]|uniref:Methyltransferase family protein n=1 Tax=Taibaiella chishuiensis TaxID=1434707 RepID=A0A2P8D8N8_9BACT|nr:class I SAM-dependent methyltransferase [Taibaiella chishuiensis]PSK93562.1 methyltransferase family protein [Taibaiella chishuiensis]
MNSPLLTRDEILKQDQSFDKLYPRTLEMMSGQHWTPLRVARLAADFLSSGPPSRILDIGSGAGKFCLAGALRAPGHHFYGIEQRAYLTDAALTLQRKLAITNVHFLHGNFTKLDLQQFDHFYFFNSFYENLNEEGRIDDTMEYSDSLYRYYVRFLHKGLSAMPKGTRIATYHSLYEEIPLSYRLADTLEGGNLNFWIKSDNG